MTHSIDRTCRIAVIFAAVILSGCALPIYAPDPAIPHTQLNTNSMKSPQICVDGKPFSLSTTPEGVASIPAGKRIAVASAFMTGDGRMNYSCRPIISFIPKEKVGYVGVLFFRDNACYLQVLQENLNTRTGLDWEPTVARGVCSAKAE